MFESCRAHCCVGVAGDEPRVVGDFGSYVRERDAVDCACDATNGLAIEDELVVRCGFAFDVENA
jgi:hypothetical protein